jgi:hypothetical protein
MLAGDIFMAEKTSGDGISRIPVAASDSFLSPERFYRPSGNDLITCEKKCKFSSNPLDIFLMVGFTT